ncbi:MAG TPA: RNA-binding protein [Xanthobacteraceae bacterium]|nr:RNA-binding protein [Xanthobacteraceae bacterium]
MTAKRLRRPRDPVQLGKLIGDILTGQVEDRAPESYSADLSKDPAAVALGRKGGLKGGNARATKMTAKQRADIARKAARARWSK